MKPKEFWEVTKPDYETILGLTVLATEMPIGTTKLCLYSKYEALESRHKKLLNAVIKISQCKKIIEGDTVDLAQKAIVEDEKASEE